VKERERRKEEEEGVVMEGVVDNPCCFMPQDKVQEFFDMTHEGLLKKTLEMINPE